MQYLILGADGYIGNYLFKRMKKDSLKAIGTSHRQESNSGFIYYDILENPISDVTKLIKEEQKTAILCIAQANIDKCKIEYELSREINVIATKRVIQSLVQENFQVICFSTDNVFDGTRGNYSESDQTNAINQYGKMKEEIEHFLLKELPEVCIFRLPKVLGMEKDRKNILTDLENKLNDEQIKCIKRSKISIVSIEDIYQACLIASERKMKGIYNLSSGEIYSRKELAVKFYEQKGIYDKEIVELELEEFGFRDNRPLKINLDNSKFSHETGYKFMSFDTLIKHYLKLCENPNN